MADGVLSRLPRSAAGDKHMQIGTIFLFQATAGDVRRGEYSRPATSHARDRDFLPAEETGDWYRSRESDRRSSVFHLFIHRLRRLSV